MSAPFSLDHSTVIGWIALVVIGAGFGAALEMAGFSYAPNLAAQFYGKDMRVLKTMFTAIVTAMLLIFFSSAIGVLDFRSVAISTTYLWPGIVGGLVMGAGFVVAGFCPGTSLTAAATGSRDALAYLAGLVLGVVGFGETVSSFSGFFASSDLGRFTISEWLGVPTGAVVLVVVVMAIGIFVLVERIEQNLGSPVARTPKNLAVGLATSAVLLGAVVAIGQQPSWEDHWDLIAANAQPLLDSHEVQLHPAEVLTLMTEDHVVLLDVRDAEGYEAFHIAGARNEGSDLQVLHRDVRDLKLEPSGTIFVAIAEDGPSAEDAWRLLTAEDVPNAYILDGGIDLWLRTFGPDTTIAAAPDLADYDIDFEPKLIEVTEITTPPTDGGCG